MLGPVFLCSEDGAGVPPSLAELAARLQDQLSLESGRRDLRVYSSLQQLAPDESEPEAVRVAVELGAVMVPVVTPGLLLAPWSRQAVLDFDQVCREEGLMGLLVPLLWERTPALDHPDDDDLASLLKGRQFVDFTELRFEDWGHIGKRRGLENLGRTVLAALKRGARPDSLRSVPPATPLLSRGPSTEPSPAALRDLAALLGRMYTVRELRMLPRRLPSADRLESIAPTGGASHALQAATDLVRVLARNGGIDAELFALLRRERPLRKAEIDSVAMRILL